MTPCRIVDTRVAGGKIANASRTFKATGTLTAQGGYSSGCGVPATAVAVVLNVGAIGSTTGYLKAWAPGTAEPKASIVNYPKTQPIANMVTVPLSGSGTFTVRSYGSADTYVDVAGYYTKPLYALVDFGGSLDPARSSGVVSMTKPATGRYLVKFNRDIRSCSATASSLQWASAYDVSPDTTYNELDDPTVVEVGIVDATNTFSNATFYLSLTC